MFTEPRTSESGQGLVEYALLLVLVAVVIIIILGLTGNQVAVKFCDIVIQLGGTTPDSVTVCRAPRITLNGLGGGQTVSGFLPVEAVIKNNHGLMTSNLTVDFTIDGSPLHTEHVYHYCMSGGDTSCDTSGDGTPYDTHHLSNGTHTLHVLATDSASGLTGETTVTFIVAN